MKHNNAFTLVELMVTIGIVAILMGIVLVALNPEKQFRSAREAKRMADAQVLLDATSQFLADHKTENVFSKDNQSRYIARGQYKSKWSLSVQPVQTPNIDLCTLLVPQYMASLPSDPFLETEIAGCDNYDTGYMLTVTPEGRIILSAPYSESQPIVITR